MAVIALLDVNVLVALAWPNHVHHDAAHAWFSEHRINGWATCPITEAGFVRISCNPAAVGQTVTPSDAVGLLRSLIQQESHSFWPLEISMAELPEDMLTRVQGYRQITDTVLLATAIQRNGLLATLDSGLARLATENRLASVCVIPI